ncbi:MAG: HEAT repeat domain-containing protein [Bacillota bacterium]
MKTFRLVLILFILCGSIFTGCSNTPEGINEPAGSTGGLPDAPAGTDAAAAAASAEYAEKVEKLLADLQSGDKNKISVAVIELGKLKEKQAVEPLIELLSLDDFYVRGYIIDALGQIKDERAIEPLSVFLEGGRFCRAAAKAIGTIGGEKAVLVLTDAFQGDDYDYLSGIAEGLAATGSPQAEQLLIDALNDKGNHEYLRRSVAEALGAFKDETAVKALIAIFTDYKVTGNTAETASSALKGSVSSALKAIGAGAVQPLLDKLNELTASPDNSYTKNEILGSVIHLLGSLGDRRAAGPLIAILKDKGNYYRRGDAADALGMIKDPEALQPLIDAFNESLALVHLGEKELAKQSQYNALFSSCTRALGLLGGDRAISLLVTTSYDGDEQIRMQMIGVLCDMSHPLITERFNQALEEEDIPVIASACYYFIYLGEPGSEPLLIKALEEYGNAGMLNGYLNCGNQQLEDAARTWAKNNNYGIISMPALPGNSSTQWGAGQ